jgi:putative transposase
MSLPDSYLNNQQRKRRTIRLKEYDYSTPWWYYVTICAFDRKLLFGEIKNGKMVLNEIGKIVKEEWLKTKEVRKNVDLDYYIIMPNHMHVVIIIEPSIENLGATRWVAQDNKERVIQRITPTNQTLISNSLGSIIGQFKSKVTKRVKKLSGNPLIKIWQRNYYEHIIRNELDLLNIRKYIELNPLKWELDEYYLSNGLR